MFIQWYYAHPLREILLKKGPPSNSLPKTFGTKFPLRGMPQEKLAKLSFLEVVYP
jgi:hypothetical protein